MSTDLNLYGGSDLLPSDARRVGRATSRHHAAARVRVAGVDTDTDVAIGKADAYTQATGNAAGNVVRVAQAMRHLELLAPEASGRLALLADDHALAMAEILGDLRRDLRRR